jgi:exonuclease III
MKILSWNCRGLSRPSAVQTLRVLIRENSPDILFLSETKSPSPQVSSILHSLGFFLICQVSPAGSKGGLALTWRPGVELECFISNKNNISAWCYSDPIHSPWILSCIYGPPDRKEKPAFWDSFTTVSDNFVSPWMCIGDLNFVLDQSEKQGGSLVASSSSCPFKKFIDHFGLVDLGFAGNPFTWCNQRQGHATIKERLDRGLASLSWIHLHTEYSILHLPATNSDHHPILLNTTQPAILPRPFRFEAFWARDPSCEAIIKSAWNRPVQGPPAHCLIRKQFHTKISLKRWNSTHFGRIQKNIKSTKDQIDKVQQLPPCSSPFPTESNLKIALNELLLQEETLWKSKSRENWLTCTDLNTKFFHTSTLIRRRSNAVNFLKTNEGGWVSDRSEIGGNFVDHFSSLFSTTSPQLDDELLELFPPAISDEENLSLISIPTEKEVFEVLSSLGSSKAPGPDGFTALFYKKYWSVVKKEVLECVLDFFLNKNLASEQNHTFITLIPKQSGAHSVNHFRPISLCNISYKIISKLLANRFKLLLPKIISPLQSAFVPNRSIQDNSIIAHELLHSFKLKRGKGGFMFLKIDMEKAFDKMEWKLILSIMQSLGFHSTWLQWIESCISSSSFSILLNGSPFGLFSPKRGLKQGDPLSPFLFILGTEVLSRLLLKEERVGNLKGIKIARNCTAINHLLFADDLLLFGKASILEATTIKGCLDKYCSWSGQSINSRKSSIRFSKNTNPTTSSSILNILPYNPNPTSSIYLGLTILLGRSKREAFQSIIDSIQTKMEGCDRCLKVLVWTP